MKQSSFNRSRMQLILLGLLGLAISTTSLAQNGPTETTATREKQALHVANRLGYGPRSGEVEQIMQMGVSNYINAQLHPEKIPLPVALSDRLAALSTQDESTGAMLKDFSEARKEAKNDSERG